MTSIKQELDRMLKRSLALCGTTHTEAVVNGEKKMVEVATDKAVKDFMTTLAASTATDKELCDKLIAAWEDGTGNLQKSLNAARVEMIGNFIVSESTFQAMFFNIIGLAPDEEPYYFNDTRQEVRVGSLGEDGTPERVRIVRSQEKTAVGLYQIASDKVRYRTADIYRGDVSQAAQSNIDLARDLRIKLDRIHRNALLLTVANGGCFGVFSTEQTRANVATRIYVNHSNIVTANLPTTNNFVNGTGTGGTSGADARWNVRYYDPTSTSASGFRPAVLLSIEDYCQAWGDVLPYGMTGTRLVPTGDILVPSCDIIDIARYFTLVSNTLENDLQRQVQANGYMGLNFNGRSWRFIPDVTLATGTCYPSFNLKPGLSYTKQNWDRAFTKRDDEENWEERWNRRAYGIVIPSQNRPRALQIKYIA